MGRFQFGSNYVVDSFTRTFTPSEIQTLNSIPITLIPAQGAGQVIQIISGVATLDFVTAAYTNSDLGFLIVPSGTSDFAQVLAFLDLAFSSNKAIEINVAGGGVYAANEPVVLYSSADSAVGDSIIKITFLYSITLL